MTDNDAIRVSGLQKTFRGRVVLKDVTFSIKRGTIFALLGANGAGKSTTVNILSTLLKADAGEAYVGGSSVREHPADVRRLIGLTGQFAAVDDLLTGRENLELIGELYGLRRQEVRGRIPDLLNRLELTEAADRRVSTYSGGMRRKLDLAAGLIARPEVVFLDEPTTGLDPRSRQETWRLVEELAKEGTTILLTTQYLEEADRLADDIAVLHNGIIVARGTAAELKRMANTNTLDDVFMELTKREEA